MNGNDVDLMENGDEKLKMSSAMKKYREGREDSFWTAF